MSFLDNLENTLKNMERASGREEEPGDAAAYEEEAARRRATAPAADALRKGQFTQALLTHCVTLGHAQKTRVGMAWIGDVLRLDAKQKRLELRPDADGVEAVMFLDGKETGRERVNLDADPADLAKLWLS